MINVANVSKKLGEVMAVNDLTINFSNGIFGLVGQNGAGKSTLFRLISNVYNQDEGQIEIDSLDSYSKEAKENLFYLSDDPYCPAFTNAKDVLNIYKCFYKIDEDYYFDLINRLNIPLNRNISTFSKGMRRQTFLALALSIEVNNLLLDEAFDGIDPLAMEIIKKEIITRFANANKTAIIASHNIETLERLCDKFVIISNGKLVNEGDEESLSRTFVKLQVAIKETLTIEAIKELGIDVVLMNKVGQVYEIICKETEKLNYKELFESKFTVILFDTIPIDYSELISLQMLVAKEEKEHE